MRYCVSVLSVLVLAGLASSQETKSQETDPKKKETPFVEPKEVLGKTFKEWMKEIHSPDPSRREEAMKTILAFGPERANDAVPEILKELGRHKKINVDLAVRVNGIVTLSTILRHQKQVDATVLKEAAGIFKMCLKDSQSIMRVRAVQGVPALGPMAHDLLPEVIAVAHDPLTWELRKEGLQTMTMIGVNANGVPSPQVLPELRKALDDSSVQVRMTALNALNLISHANLSKQDVAATLAKLNAHAMTEIDKGAALMTHVTIMSFTKDVNKQHVGPILASLKSNDPKIRLQALSALTMVGEKVKPLAQDDIEQAIHDPETSVAANAMVALVRLHCVESVPALQKVVNDKKVAAPLRETAEEAIDQLKLLASKSKSK